MVIPGLLGCLASAALMFDNMRDETHRSGDVDEAAQVPSLEHTPPVRPDDLPQPPVLEDMLTGGDGPLAWRVFVRRWMDGPT